MPDRLGEPFAGFANFDDCLSQGNSPEVCATLQAQFEKLKEIEYRKKFIKIHELGEHEIREAFEWVPNMERVKQWNREGHGVKYYAVEALHEGITDPKNVGHGRRKYTNEELKRAARTLVGGFLNWNHQEKLTVGRNGIVDAEWSDKSNAIEAIIGIEDVKAQRSIAEGRVKHVSVQAPAPRTVAIQTDGTSVPEGLVFEGLALITEDQTPGDPRSSIKLIEIMGVKDSSLNGEASKTKPMPTDQDFRTVTLPAIIKALDESNMAPELKLGFGAMARQTFSEVEHPGECPPGQHMGPGGACVMNEQECPSGQHRAADGSCVMNEQECPVGQERGPDGECHPVEPMGERFARINRQFKNLKEGLADDILKSLKIEFKDDKTGQLIGLDPSILASLTQVPNMGTQLGEISKKLGEIEEAMKPEKILAMLKEKESQAGVLEVRGKGGRSISMPRRKSSLR